MAAAETAPRDPFAWQQVLPVPQKTGALDAPALPSEDEPPTGAGSHTRSSPSSPKPQREIEVAARLKNDWRVVDADLVIFEFGLDLIESNLLRLAYMDRSGQLPELHNPAGYFMAALRNLAKNARDHLHSPQRFAAPEPAKAEPDEDLTIITEAPAGAWTEDECARELWAQALEALRDKTPRPNFKRYLADTFAHSLIGDTLTIVAPSSFTAEWLERHFSSTISRELERQRGNPVKLRIAVASAGLIPDSSDVAAAANGFPDAAARQVSGLNARGNR